MCLAPPSNGLSTTVRAFETSSPVCGVLEEVTTTCCCTFAMRAECRIANRPHAPHADFRRGTPRTLRLLPQSDSLRQPHFETGTLPTHSRLSVVLRCRCARTRRQPSPELLSLAGPFLSSDLSSGIGAKRCRRSEKVATSSHGYVKKLIFIRFSWREKCAHGGSHPATEEPAAIAGRLTSPFPSLIRIAIPATAVRPESAAPAICWFANPCKSRK